MLIAVKSSYKLVVFPLTLPPGFLLFFFFSIIEMFSSYLHAVGGEFDKREKKVKAAEQDREKQEQEWEGAGQSPGSRLWCWWGRGRRGLAHGW